MENCIFCKIGKGEIPCNKVYEDKNFLAFLDAQPVNIGHSLVVTKKHFKNIYEIPDETLAQMMKIVKKISMVVKKEMKADGINVHMNNEKAAGQVIDHVHIHIIPRFENDGFTHWHGKRGYNEGEKEDVSKKITQGL